MELQCCGQQPRCREALAAVGEVEDELLPMIHQNWPPVAARFADPDFHVALGAWRVAERMAALSGSFVHRKLCLDLWPRLLLFLRHSLPHSLDSGPVYAHSARARLQHGLLRTLGSVARQAKLKDDLKAQTLAVLREYLVRVLQMVLCVGRLPFVVFEAQNQPDAFKSAAQASLTTLEDGNDP